MALSIPRLRSWFAVLALVAVVVVAGFYVRARIEMRRALRNLPGKVGVNIQQTSEGFTLSKSEGGRTLFTIHAAKATQFKQGGRAALHDVRIVVYGRQADRFDQIYGSDFEYDPAEAKVVSQGEVQIDLGGVTGKGGAASASSGGTSSGGAPVGGPPDGGKESNGAIHLRLEGMSFDQRTGVAESRGRVDFRLPQAAGTARGASYDSKRNELRLASQIDVTTVGPQPTHILARSGSITKEPRQLTLEAVQISGAGRTIRAEHTVAHLAADNAVQRVDATGEVRLSDSGGMRLRAPRGELLFGAGSAVESAWFGGGVEFESGQQAADGHSGEMRMLFAPGGTKQKTRGRRARGSSQSAGLQTIYASQGVELRQAARQEGRNPQSLTMTSNGMTFGLEQTEGAPGKAQRLSWARTEGPGKLTIRSADSNRMGEETVIDARGFSADFGEEGRLSALRGDGAVQVVSRAPGEPEKVSTSEKLVAEFGPSGELLRAVQEGNFRFREAQGTKSEPGGRNATAAAASYSPPDDVLTLTGGPRIVDGGMTVEADSIRGLRRSSEFFAVGHVKTTYSQLSVQPNGALLASGDPIHVTAHAMHVQRNPKEQSGVARYTGGARLWQGSNVIEGQTVDFDEKARTIAAVGDEKHPVTSVFLQVDGKGRASTVLVTAPKLIYDDHQRQAHYSGGMTAKGAEGVLTAARADIYLRQAGLSPAGAPRGASQSAQGSQSQGSQMQGAQMQGAQIMGPSQLERIVASTRVVVQQKNRRGEGDKLVYEASTGMYRMTGGPPMLSDPVNGTVRGDSLTFYSHDDTVVVEGGEGSRAVTHTHISR